MSRYGALTGKKKKVLPIKKESPRKFKKIIVGMKGSGKTGALIKEIEFALSEHISPLPVYLQYYNHHRGLFKSRLGGFYKNLKFKSFDFRNFYEMCLYKVVFIDDLILENEIVDYLLRHIYASSNLEGIIITCDLIRFMDFMGQRTDVWKHLQNHKWIVEQLNGSV